ncbi:MAG TPA: FG-GAP-like repeat-containing protein, partial [Gemmata sp.]|nr:FG-GAP-like repeat-containing protein [Gemmata sp.]
MQTRSNEASKQAQNAPSIRGNRSHQLVLEQLEDRDLPSITIQISYAYDTSGFFANNPTAKATLQLAANDLTSAINTSLAAITPSGTNTWDESFYDPANGQIVTVNDPTIAANTIVVYAGARSLGSSQASEGAFGGYGISGTQAWVDTLQSRSPGWGSLLWGGSIVFDTATSWYFGSSASGLTSSREDFFTSATHELAHVLGIGTSTKWFSEVAGTNFTGSHSEKIYGGSVPLTWGNSELNNVTVKGIASAMNLNLPMGVRTAPFTSLDWALLQDTGWSVTIPSPPVAPPASPPPVAVPPPASTTPAPVLVSGTNNGLVYVYTVNSSGTLTATGQTFDPFPGSTGTIRTAVADFNGDGVPDYAFVTGPGTAAEVRIVNGATGANIVAPTPILSGFTGGAFVTAGDVNGNGTNDLVVSEDAGGQPLVKVFQIVNNQLQVVAGFLAFGSSMNSGVRIAMGDITHNGIDDLVAGAGPGSAPWVEIYNGAYLAKGQAVLLTPAILAFPSTVTAGVNVAVGDITRDGYADLIVSQDAGGSSLVEIWSGATIAANLSTPISSLPAYVEFYANGMLNTGMRITTDVVNGVTELITAPASGSLDWMRVLTATSSSVTPSAAVFPF